MSQVLSILLYLVECRRMYVQMNWLLIKKEYIIVFAYVILAIVDHTLRITSTKWFTHVHTKTFEMAVNPGPKGIVINLVYSNHV